MGLTNYRVDMGVAFRSKLGAMYDKSYAMYDDENRNKLLYDIMVSYDRAREEKDVKLLVGNLNMVLHNGTKSKQSYYCQITCDYCERACPPLYVFAPGERHYFESLVKIFLPYLKVPPPSPGPPPPGPPPPGLLDLPPPGPPAGLLPLPLTSSSSSSDQVVPLDPAQFCRFAGILYQEQADDSGIRKFIPMHGWHQGQWYENGNLWTNNGYHGWGNNGYGNNGWTNWGNNDWYNSGWTNNGNWDNNSWTTDGNWDNNSGLPAEPQALPAALPGDLPEDASMNSDGKSESKDD